MLLDVLVVLSRHLEIYFVIRVNVYFWTPFKIRILRPEKWHWSSKLNVRKHVLFASVLCQKDKLSLCGIGCISIEITSSGNPSFPLSSLISSWHQSYLTSVIDTSMSEVYDNKSRNKPSNPFISLNFNEIVNPITIVHVTESLVFHWTICVQKCLQGIGEVIIVTEVKVFTGKHLFQSLDVNFVLWGLLMPQTKVLNFLNLEYLAMINLADDRCFGHYDQIVIDFHLYNSIHCLYRYFLWLG